MWDQKYLKIEREIKVDDEVKKKTLGKRSREKRGSISDRRRIGK